ncbi:hypothetical protein P4I85_26150 [Bacillus cereus]|nr:hypothetical protein [Bacillus cereus]
MYCSASIKRVADLFLLWTFFREEPARVATSLAGIFQPYLRLFWNAFGKSPSFSYLFMVSSFL